MLICELIQQTLSAWNRWGINNIVIMNDEQLQLIIADLTSNTLVQDVCERVQLEGNEKWHHLAESIRNNPRARKSYEVLTDDKLITIVHEFENLFGDLSHYSIEDWGNTLVVERFAEAHYWLRNELQQVLNFRVSWSVVSKITNAVLGYTPVISSKLKRYLYENGCLQNPRTENICSLMTGINKFFTRNHDAIVDIVNDIAIHGMFALGMSENPKNILTILVPIVLTGISRITYREFTRNLQNL